MALTLEFVVSAVFASGTLRAYYELSALTPNPSPNPPRSPLRGGRTKDVSLLLHGRGELFIFSG